MIKKDNVFSIDDLISRWSVSVPKYWFDKLEKIPTRKLKVFFKNVQKRKKDLMKRQAFSSPINFTLYHMLKSAIKHEFIKRSVIKMTIFKSFLPIKAKIVWVASHKKQRYQWGRFVYYEYVDTGNFLYKGIHFYLKRLAEFGLRNWKFIVTTIIASISLFIYWKKG